MDVRLISVFVIFQLNEVIFKKSEMMMLTIDSEQIHNSSPVAI